MGLRFRDPDFFPSKPRCDGCDTTEKWVAEFAVSCSCHMCGKLHEPRGAGERADAKQDALSELDNLARWTPDILGKAIPLEPPLLPADEFSSATTGRMRPEDCDPDGETVGGIDGLTLHVSGRRYPQATPGRPEHVDDAAEQFGHAVRTLRRLDALVASSRAGARHAIVLLYAGWHHGPESRGYWERVDDDALVYGEDDSAAYYIETGAPRAEPLGFNWRLGWFAAPEETRALWLASEYLTLPYAAARTLGRESIEASVKAFAQVPLEPPRGEAARIDLGLVEYTIGIVERAVDMELIGALRARVHERRHKVRKSLS